MQERRSTNRHESFSSCPFRVISWIVFAHKSIGVRLCDFAILTQSQLRYGLTISDANLLTFTLVAQLLRVPFAPSPPQPVFSPKLAHHPPREFVNGARTSCPPEREARTPIELLQDATERAAHAGGQDV